MANSFAKMLLFVLWSAFLPCRTSAKTNLRPTKKYLRCSVETFGCGSNDDRVHLCHFNGLAFATLCVRSRSSIVEHLHAQDYCGQCVQGSPRTPFANREELQTAVDRYLDDPSSHKLLGGKYGYPMGQWDVSQVEDFSHLFAKRVDFNQDISMWNTQAATDMSFMFWHAHSFAGEIGHWDVSRVVTMERMFFGAEQFNDDLSHWQTSSLTNLMGTFWRAMSFNSPLNSWDTSKVLVMSRCFSDATSFNQPLDQWDTHAVADMSFMFLQATSFQQDLSPWNVQHVRSLEGMFSKVPHFANRQVQIQLLTSWKLQQGVVVTHMFSAPRDLSLRAQKLQAIQLDVETIMRATSRQDNATRTKDARPQGVLEGEVLSREILCHGGVCM